MEGAAEFIKFLDDKGLSSDEIKNHFHEYVKARTPKMPEQSVPTEPKNLFQAPDRLLSARPLDPFVESKNCLSPFGSSVARGGPSSTGYGLFRAIHRATANGANPAEEIKQSFAAAPRASTGASSFSSFGSHSVRLSSPMSSKPSVAAKDELDEIAVQALTSLKEFSPSSQSHARIASTVEPGDSDADDDDDDDDDDVDVDDDDEYVAPKDASKSRKRQSERDIRPSGQSPAKTFNSANASSPSGGAMKRPRGRPRLADHLKSSPSARAAAPAPPVIGPDGLPKRGRGRPRKYPLPPSEGAKAAAAINVDFRLSKEGTLAKKLATSAPAPQLATPTLAARVANLTAAAQVANLTAAAQVANLTAAAANLTAAAQVAGPAAAARVPTPTAVAAKLTAAAQVAGPAVAARVPTPTAAVHVATPAAAAQEAVALQSEKSTPASQDMGDRVAATRAAAAEGLRGVKLSKPSSASDDSDGRGVARRKVRVRNASASSSSEEGVKVKKPASKQQARKRIRQAASEDSSGSSSASASAASGSDESGSNDSEDVVEGSDDSSGESSEESSGSFMKEIRDRQSRAAAHAEARAQKPTIRRASSAPTIPIVLNEWGALEYKEEEIIFEKKGQGFVAVGVLGEGGVLEDLSPSQKSLMGKWGISVDVRVGDVLG